MAEFIDLTEAERRPMRVCSYVELPFELVFDQLASRSGREALASAVLAALDDGAAPVELTIRQPEMVSRGVARLRLWWERPGAREGIRSATLSVLAVQSGNGPLTELLVDVSIRAETATHAATAVHRLLGEIEHRLTPADA